MAKAKKVEKAKKKPAPKKKVRAKKVTRRKAAGKKITKPKTEILNVPMQNDTNSAKDLGASLGDSRELITPARRVVIPAGFNYVLYKNGRQIPHDELAFLNHTGVLPDFCNPFKRETLTKEQSIDKVMKMLRSFDDDTQNEIMATILFKQISARNEKAKQLQSEISGLQVQLKKAEDQKSKLEAIRKGDGIFVF